MTTNDIDNRHYTDKRILRFTFPEIITNELYNLLRSSNENKGIGPKLKTSHQIPEMFHYQLLILPAWFYVALFLYTNGLFNLLTQNSVKDKTCTLPSKNKGY